MISVKEIIIVEGEYDKIKLSNFIDGIIYVTGGFSIMQDKERTSGLATMVEECGGVILTDSDSAGFRIRNYLRQKLPENKLLNAYIPDVVGKERRKSKSGAEGLLGVEGMTEEILVKALKDAGCTVDGNVENVSSKTISKSELYRLGLTGRTDSKLLRTNVQKRLGIPEKLSTKMLCDYLSRKMDIDRLAQIVEEVKKNI